MQVILLHRKVNEAKSGSFLALRKGPPESRHAAIGAKIGHIAPDTHGHVRGIAGREGGSFHMRDPFARALAGAAGSLTTPSPRSKDELRLLGAATPRRRTCPIH